MVVRIASQKMDESQIGGHPKQHANNPSWLNKANSFPKEAPTIIPETDKGKVRNLAAAIQAFSFFINEDYRTKIQVKKKSRSYTSKLYKRANNLCFRNIAFSP